MEVIWVTEALYKDGFKIYVKFNDGISGIVDLANKLKGPIFEPLKDPTNFKDFTLNAWTIQWPNGADLAPEYLYELATQKLPITQEK